MKPDNGGGQRHPWLGERGAGADRLARAFGIVQETSPPDELDELRARVGALEQELDGLRPPALPEPGADGDGHRFVDLPRLPLVSDRDYWLCRCEGFAVYAGDRLLGTVDELRFESRVDRPDLLRVRRRRSRRPLLVPVSLVQTVRPDLGAIHVADAGAPQGYATRLSRRVRRAASRAD